MAVRVGIDGFGRIGGNIYRVALERPDVEVVAINDVSDTKTLAHLLKYDSVLRNLDNQVTAGDKSISVDDHSFRVFGEPDPSQIPWGSVDAEVVVESTDLFTNGPDAKKHLRDSVRKVIISAPAKEEDVTLVVGGERRPVRRRPAQRYLERLVHDELPGAGRQGAARELRHQQGDYDDSV